ncbi:hypothetical protein BC938DRAFT_478898 [Jimgerdemannia flammicorona]|uniref:Uncharacterized protein n=1 Tax=Jimgerdemannia flammicorona TaxID=994334 RepID=A0A433QM42_9FUNG|nr:hypothetical protein BC938DRAFT_478898 [Jimgerdemannia flammicorona]
MRMLREVSRVFRVRSKALCLPEWSRYSGVCDRIAQRKRQKTSYLVKKSPSIRDAVITEPSTRKLFEPVLSPFASRLDSLIGCLLIIAANERVKKRSKRRKRSRPS